MLIEVTAPDEEEIYAEALAWSDANAGIITIVVPPVVTRASDVLGPMVVAMGGTPLARPPSGEAQAVENAVVRLRAHGIHSAILLLAQWIPGAVFADLAVVTTLGGIDLYVISHPVDDDPVIAPAWRSGTWRFMDLRAFVAEHAAAWRMAASDPARHQRAAMPALGVPGVARPVPDVPQGDPGAVDAAFLGVQRRLPVAPSLHLAATILRHALRSARGAMHEPTLAGAAAALRDAGFAVMAGDATANAPEWRTLRRIPDTTAAAAVTLVALGLDEAACARLESGAVDVASGRVIAGHRVIAVPPAARPYLSAHRLVRDGLGGTFLTVAGRPAGPTAVRDLVIEGAAHVGRALDARDFDRGLSPSQRWLMAHGLLVRRTRDADPARQPRDRDASAVRCRHALAAWVEVDGGGIVSHSQKLCRAVEIEDARPTSDGYRISGSGVTEHASGFVVATDAGEHGALWQVRTPLGPVWVQCSARVRPSIGAVADAVRRAQLQPRDRGHSTRVAPAGVTRLVGVPATCR